VLDEINASLVVVAMRRSSVVTIKGFYTGTQVPHVVEDFCKIARRSSKPALVGGLVEGEESWLRREPAFRISF
jgi:hypothetical protein